VSFRKKITAFYTQIREKNKLTFIDDRDYREKWSFNVSTLNLFTLLALYTIIILVLLFFMIRYTPLKSLFIENSTLDSKVQIENNAQLIDSLYEKTNSTQLYLNDLKTILSDGSFVDSTENGLNDGLENYAPDFSKDVSDSVLRYKIENNDLSGNNGETDYAFFFSPVEGVISRSFSPFDDHFGVDVVTKDKDPIKACLEGVVILTGWIQSEGKVIAIQHKDNLISIYKHCATILKKKGDQVQTGDPIAIVGDTGENSSGPHLHFELWKNGKNINPEEFISF